MELRLASRIIGLILLLVSLVVLTWGIRPVTYRTQTVPITQSELSLPGENGQVPGFGTNPDQIVGRILLEWPEALRPGDAGEVRLSFNPETPIRAPAQQPDSAGGASRILQSRLELAGIQHTPTGEISQALSMDHPVVFLWNLRSRQAGDFSGTAWLHLGLTTANDGQETRKVLAAQQIEVPVKALWGLGGNLSRVLGSVGLAIGLALGLGGLILQALQSAAERSRKIV